LILLDILMPDMDGYEVCRRLKSDDILRNIPVIFLSALTELEDKVRGLRGGATISSSRKFFLKRRRWIDWVDRALRARLRGRAALQSRFAALNVLWKIARGAVDPPRRAAGDSEILFEKCSTVFIAQTA